MKKIIYINKNQIMNYIVCLFLLVPFLQPRGMAEGFEILGGIYHYINLLFNYWRLIAIFGLLIMFFLKKIHVSKFMISVCAYYVYMVFVCFLKNVDKNEAITNFIYIFGMLLIMEVFLKHFSVFIYSFEYIVGFLVILNFAMVFLFPDGMYMNARGDEGNWLFGYYNAHLFTVLPWLVVFFICSLRKNGKLKWSTILVGMICLIGIFVAGSKTSSIALLAFLVAIVISLKVGKISLPGIAVVIVISMIISYLIVILQIQTYFADFIQNVLHRDLTFTGRTVIWNAALKAFFDSPIFGNGMLVYIPASSDWTTTQAHNAFLNILANGGIIGLVLFVLMFAIVAQKMFRMEKYPYKEVIYSGMIAYGIVFITEMPSLQHMLVIVLYLGYYLDEIITEMPMNKPKKTALKFGRRSVVLLRGKSKRSEAV